MVLYTQDQLKQRDLIFQSHKHLGNFLNAEIVNILLNLFDKDSDSYFNEKISTYIENERKARDMDTSEITIKNIFYGYNDKGVLQDPTLLLEINKNNNTIIHLSFHLAINSLKPKNSGIIHIYKNIYKNINPKTEKKLLYAIILVEPIKDKPDSLKFSIADGYTTIGIDNSNKHDSILQKEMDIILEIFNRLFDEDKTEYYIGNKFNLTLVHDKTDNVLDFLNKTTQYATRKNKGKMMITPFKENKNNNYKSRKFVKKKQSREQNKTQKKKSNKIKFKNSINKTNISFNNHVNYNTIDS